MMVRFVLVTAVSFLLLLLSSCTGAAGPERVLNMAPNATVTTDGTAGTGSTFIEPPTPGRYRLELGDTPPELVEDAPLFVVDMTMTDKATGELVVADVFLYQKLLHGSLDVISAIPTIPCEQVNVCKLELPPLANGDWVWAVLVRAPGYEDWIVEFRFATLRTRTMVVPVELVRDGLVTG